LDVKERLRELMNMLHMKQYQFGESINISGPTISDWLKKPNVNPSLESLIRISEVHNVNLHWLLLGEGPMFKEGIEGDIGIIKIRINKINKMGIIEEGDEFIGIDREILGGEGDYAGYRIESGRWKPEIEEGDIIIIDKIKGGDKWEGEIGLIKKVKEVKIERIIEEEGKKWMLGLGEGRPRIYRTSEGEIIGKAILLIRQLKNKEDKR